MIITGFNRYLIVMIFYMFFHHIEIWGFCGVIMFPVICWLFAMNIVMKLSAWPPLSHIWRDKRRVSEIDLSQPKHETAFWWRHNRPVTPQLTDPIALPNYPSELIGIYVHINTQNKESLTQRCPYTKIVDRQMYNCVWYFCTYPYGLSLNVWRALLCIANNRHGVTITTLAIERHFLIWITTVRQPTKRRRSCVLTLKYTFIRVYWWTRQRIHNNLIAVDRYLRLMGDKTIPDSAEPRLESFYPPFVAGIHLPHQGEVDSYKWILIISTMGFSVW